MIIYPPRPRLRLQTPPALARDEAKTNRKSNFRTTLIGGSFHRPFYIIGRNAWQAEQGNWTSFADDDELYVLMFLFTPSHRAAAAASWVRVAATDVCRHVVGSTHVKRAYATAIYPCA